MIQKYKLQSIFKLHKQVLRFAPAKKPKNRNFKIFDYSGCASFFAFLSIF